LFRFWKGFIHIVPFFVFIWKGVLFLNSEELLGLLAVFGHRKSVIVRFVGDFRDSFSESIEEPHPFTSVVQSQIIAKHPTLPRTAGLRGGWFGWVGWLGCGF
jgi:hypothetical protein